jgi:hypothetical protein
MPATTEFEVLMTRRAGVGLALLTLVATAALAGVSAVPAAAAGKTCPSFSESGLKYFSETVGSGFTCTSAKAWVLKLIKDPADTSSGKVALTNGPKGLHCYATQDAKGHVSAGVCYKNTLAFPKSGFLWNGS